jgi:hypothetical protein
MPRRPIAANTFERTPVAEGSRDYLADAGVVELLRSWYADGGYYWARQERASAEAPDNWNVLERSEEGGRLRLLLCNNVSEACVEVSFRDEGGVPRELDLRPLPAEAAYERMMDLDEEARAQGVTIYNARHPRPASR